MTESISNDTVTIQNPYQNQVREKHARNQPGSIVKLTPFVTETGTKKSLSRSRSSIGLGQTNSSAEKPKICRPRNVSSSVTNLKSDFKLKKIIKSLKEKRYDGSIVKNKRNVVTDKRSDDPRIASKDCEAEKIKTKKFIHDESVKFIGSDGKQKNKSSQTLKSKSLRRPKSVDEMKLKKTRLNEDLLESISKSTKEMVEWLQAIRQHLSRTEQAEGIRKAKDYLMSRTLPVGNTSLQKSRRKVGISHSSSNLPTNKNKNNLKTEIDTVNRPKEQDNKVVKGVRANSGTAKDLDTLNQEISRFKRDRNAAKDSVRHQRDKPLDKFKEQEELLEIRPKYIEDIQQNPNVGISKKKDAHKSGNTLSKMAAAQTISQMKFKNSRKNTHQKKREILIDKQGHEITKSRSEPKLKISAKCNEKGFILIDEQDTNGKTSSIHSAGPCEKGFVMVDSREKSEKLFKMSKKEPYNFVLVNDNPSCKTKRDATDRGGSRSRTESELTCQYGRCGTCNESVGGNVRAVSDRLYGCTALHSKQASPGCNKAANQKQSELIGASDSTEEIRRSGRIGEECSSLSNTKNGKANYTDNIFSVNQELGKWGRIFENKLDSLTSKRFVAAQKVHSETKIHNNKSHTTKGDSVSKGSRQTNNISTKLTPVDTFENVMKTRQSYNLESSVATKDSPIRFWEMKNVPTNGSSSKTTGSASDYNRHTLKWKSTTAEVTQLKPDLQQNKKDRTPPLNAPVLKHNAEPQLFVRPEEVSKTMKLVMPVTRSISSHGLNTFTPVAESGNTKPKGTLELNTNSSKSSVSEREEKQTWPTLQLQGRYDRQIGVLTQNENDLHRNGEFQKNKSGNSRSEDAYILNRSVSFPDLIRVFKPDRSTEKLHQCQDVPTSKKRTLSSTRSSRRNDNLIRTLREQRSTSFQKPSRGHRQTSFYSPYNQRNANCLVETVNDSNISSGKNIDNTETDTAHRGGALPTPPLLSTKYTPKKKSGHLPTMGMAERLLAASKKSDGSLETGHTPSEFNSDYSVTTFSDATGKQGSAEDDFPEVDQFEEWIQSNMPEIYKDNINTPSQTTGQTMDPQSKHGNTEDVKLPRAVRQRLPSVRDGSDVDGPSVSLQTNNKFSSNMFAGPVLENQRSYHLPSEVKPARQTYLRKNKQDHTLGTLSNVDGQNRGFPVDSSRNITSPPMIKEKSVDVATKDKKKELIDDIDKKDEADKIKGAFQKKGLLSALNTSNAVNTGSSSKFMKKSAMFSSLDGFASMKLVHKTPDVSTRTLKPTLKRSSSREDSEEKRVSFMSKSSNNDNSESKYSSRDRTRHDGLELFGSSVDNRSADGSFASDEIKQESDLRKFLADQRRKSEMQARVKLITQHTKQIREYEAVLSKYKDIIGKLKDDSLGIAQDRKTPKA